MHVSISYIGSVNLVHDIVHVLYTTQDKPCNVASVPGLPRSVRVLIVRRRQNVCRLRIIKTRTERGPGRNVCRLRTIKTRTERGRPGTEAILVMHNLLHNNSITIIYTCIQGFIQRVGALGSPSPQHEFPPPEYLM